MMKAIRISPKVWWVGAIDWQLKEFHGYTTRRGSTYNAFLIMDQKITLIDTVKSVFGIASPSKVFADEIGKNLGLGVGVGFEDAMRDVS